MSSYMRFVAASGMTNLADGVAMVIWAWLASLLTRDALLVALVPVALRLPWFLFALSAGVVTDRVDRRRLIVGMDALRAAAFLVASAAIWAALPLAAAPAQGVADAGLYVMMLLCAFVVGGAEVFRDSAAQTMLPALVPHDDLERANSRLWSVETVGNALTGPALGAFLIAAAVPLPFALSALAYGVAVVLVTRIDGRFRPAWSPRRHWRVDLAEGFRFLRAAPLLRVLAWTTGMWNLLHQMVLVALVLHVQENLGLGAQAYGVVLAAGAVGGILGGMFGGYIVQVLGPARTAKWMLATSAPAFAAMALAPGAVTLAVVFAVFEFTGLTWNVVSVSYRQRAVPDALLGRVNSLYRLLAWGLMPVGLVLSGLIVQLADGRVPRENALMLPFWAAAAGGVLLTVMAWRALGRGFAAAGG